MWKQRVDAHAGLLRLDWVDVVFGLAALFPDGEDAHRGDCFKGVAWFRMHHARANGYEVAGVNNRNQHDERDGDTLCECSGWWQTTIPPGK